MLVTPTHLTANTRTLSSSATTASISPAPNQLVILTVGNKRNAGSPNIPSVSGGGMTWTQIATRQSVSFPNQRITMFRGLSSSPGTGAITIDFSGQSQDNIFWDVTEFNNVDITGTNGANAVVQVASSDIFNSSNPSVTLPAFSNINNATFGVVYEDGGNTITHGANFTELANVNSNGVIEAEWSQANNTTVNWTGGSAPYAAMALEIKAYRWAFGGGMI